jgi:hypothetical protein
MSKIYIAHVNVKKPGLSVQTLYFSSARYVTFNDAYRPVGSPSHQFYDARIVQPALMRRDCWTKGKTGGQSNIGFGTLDLVAIDGGLDEMIGWFFDGQEIKLMIGEVKEFGTPVWTTVFVGTMSPPEITRDFVKLRLRDRQLVLDKPVCVNTYLGNNSLPNGYEGTTDLEGKRKPKMFGQVFGISPPCVNTSLLIYEVNDGAAVTDAVYDGGSAFAKGTDYTSLSDMAANAPSSGEFRDCPSEGYFRLGNSPLGQVTADATEGATTADRTAAQIANRIVTTSGGLTSGDVTAGDLTALDTLQSGVVGFWWMDDTTCRAALDEVAESVGAWWGFDNLSMFKIVRFDVPSGSPVASFTNAEIMKIDRLNAEDGGLPTWKAIVQYKRNYTVQKTDYASGITQARKAIISEEYAKTIQSDSAVKTESKLALESTFRTHFVSRTVASAEATRLLDLYKVQRNRFEVQVKTDAATAAAIDLGAVVNLTHNRFGMSSGKDLRVIGFKTDLRTNTSDLTLWG